MSIKRTIAKYKIAERKREQVALAKAERKAMLRDNKLRKQREIQERKARLNKEKSKVMAERKARIAKVSTSASKTFRKLRKWYNR